MEISQTVTYKHQKHCQIYKSGKELSKRINDRESNKTRQTVANKGKEYWQIYNTANMNFRGQAETSRQDNNNKWELSH